MRGSTYRYFTGGPLFPFGSGLSYTKCVYSNLRFESKSVKAGEAVKVSADVMNAGERAARKGPIVSHHHEGICACADSHPGWIRTYFAPANRKSTVTFTIAPRQMSLIDDRAKRVIEPGEFLISVGELRDRFTVSGNLLELPEL